MVASFKDIGNLDENTRKIGVLDEETEINNLRLKTFVINHLKEHGPGSVLGSQNDGDELIHSDVLHHLQKCEFKKEVAVRA